MDPITALSLVCNVLQLVETGYEGLALCWRLYNKGEDVQTANVREARDNISKVFERLREMLEDTSLPPASAADDQDLLNLCNKCQEISLALSDELTSLVLPVKSNIFLVVGKAFKSSQKAGKIRQLKDRLDDVRGALDSRILVSVHTSLRRLDLDLQIVKSTLDQKSCDIIDRIVNGQVSLAKLVSEDSLACRNMIEKEHQTTRDHIDTANANLSTLVIENSSKIQDKIGLLVPQVNTSHRSQSDLFESVMKELRYPEIFARPESISPAHRGTFEWIFEERRFKQWMENDVQLFWIQGKAGSGKSTLANFLMEESENESGSRMIEGLGRWTGGKPPGILSFYFWENGTQLQRSTEGLFRSLLWQLLSLAKSSNESMMEILSIRGLAELGQKSIPLGIKQLRRWFPAVVQKLGQPICLFLDGLDEFNEDQDLLDMIEDLRSLPKLKICAFSRSSPAFESYFEDEDKLRLHELTRPAIAKFVRDKLESDNKMKRLVLRSPRLAQGLIDELLWRADGVFLWVKLVVQDLIRGLRNNDDFATLQKRLERLPTQLNDLYEYMWNRTRDDHEMYFDDAVLYFGLVLRKRWLYETPSLLSFHLAANDSVRKRCLGLMTDINSEWLGLDMDEEHVQTRIQVCTAGLVEVRPEVHLSDLDFESDDETAKLIQRSCKASVTFIHKSVSEFLAASPTMKGILEQQNQSDELEERAMEAEIVEWGLKLMTQALGFCELPKIQDNDTSLPWFVFIESFLHRVSQQQNFRGFGFDSLFKFNSHDLCQNSSCASKTICIGKHVEIDIVPWAFMRGFGHVVKNRISAGDYPKELLSNLFWIHNARCPVDTSLLQYLLENGADPVAPTVAPVLEDADPSLTALDVLLTDLIRCMVWRPKDHKLLSASTHLLLKNFTDHEIRFRPMLHSNFFGDGTCAVMCDWSLYDYACAEFSHHTKREEAETSAELDEILNLLKPTNMTKEKRAYVLVWQGQLWPITQDRSQRFFVELPNIYYMWRVFDRTPGCIHLNLRVPDIGTLASILGHEEPFKTLYDAYKYAGWTDEELERYSIPLTLGNWADDEDEE